MTVTIKQATLEDLKTIQDFNAALCKNEQEHYDATIAVDYPYGEEGTKDFTEAITQADRCAFLAFLDEQIVGYLVGGVEKAPEWRTIKKIAELQDMFVVEEHRSIGVGKALVDAFFTWASEQGVDRASVIATAQNQKAIHFYKREGFEEYELVLEKKMG